MEKKAEIKWKKNGFCYFDTSAYFILLKQIGHIIQNERRGLNQYK